MKSPTIILQVGTVVCALIVAACKPEHQASALSPEPEASASPPQLQASPPSTDTVEAPSPTYPPDTMPSTRLKHYLDTHLDQILAPLDAKGLKRSDSIINFRTSLADAMSKAAPSKLPAFQAALVLCDTLSNDSREREVAITNLHGLNSSQAPASLTTTTTQGPLTKTELKRDIHNEKRARSEAKQTEATFVGAQKNTWEQRAIQLRKEVQQAFLQEQKVERQISISESAKAIVAARQEAIRRHPNLAVQGSKFNAAFVARYVYYQQQQPGYFQDPSWPLRLAEEVSQSPQSR